MFGVLHKWAQYCGQRMSVDTRHKTQDTRNISHRGHREHREFVVVFDDIVLDDFGTTPYGTP